MASVIIEIRAGTGGKEAALFAADLFKMYSRYAQNQGWQQKILDSQPTELSGIKQVVFELKPASTAKRGEPASTAKRGEPASTAKRGENNNVFEKMKHEGGVHRVQRIPKTEKSGRIHTSTATVAVFLKPKKNEINIRTDELKIDHYRASGPGGQYVNKRETAVRITHLPTGIIVTSQTQRGQLQNKENALSILQAKILEHEELKNIEELTKERRAQIKWARRVDKIRTYNFPQNRITDHRIKKSWHKLDSIMDGKLEPIIKTMKKLELEEMK